MAPEWREFWRTQRRPARRAAAYVTAWGLLVAAAVLAYRAGSRWMWPIEAATLPVAVLALWTAMDIGDAAVQHYLSHEDRS